MFWLDWLTHTHTHTDDILLESSCTYPMNDPTDDDTSSEDAPSGSGDSNGYGNPLSDGNSPCCDGSFDENQ